MCILPNIAQRHLRAPLLHLKEGRPPCPILDAIPALSLVSSQNLSLMLSLSYPWCYRCPIPDAITALSLMPSVASPWLHPCPQPSHFVGKATTTQCWWSIWCSTTCTAPHSERLPPVWRGQGILCSPTSTKEKKARLKLRLTLLSVCWQH